MIVGLMSVVLMSVGLLGVGLMKQHLVLGLVVVCSSPCCVSVTLVFLILGWLEEQMFDGMDYGR